MAGGSPNTQAVFLIDVSAPEITDPKWGEGLSLCVFRLLSFLNSQSPRQTSDRPSKQQLLKWGYKFFNSDGHRLRTGATCTSFRDFKLRYFEEFERNLRNILTDDTPVRTRSQQDQTAARRGSTGSSYPAQTLSKSLTELVHDFQWEVPDIGSPVKTRRVSQGGAQGNSRSTNLVFLFSRVPVDRRALRHFANKVVIDSCVFTESLMSTMLQKEFCVQRGIKLFWIDTGRYHPPPGDAAPPIHLDPPDRKSFDIVQQSVKKLGGNLLLFDALVTRTLWKGSSPHHVDETERQAENVSGVYTNTNRDIATVLSAFSCTSVCSSLILHSLGSEIQTGKGHRCTPHTLPVPDFSLVLQDTKKSECVIPLDLAPIFQESESATAASQMNGHRAHAAVSMSRLVAAMAEQGEGRTRLTLRPYARLTQIQARLMGNSLVAHCLCRPGTNISTESCQAFSGLLRSLRQDSQCLVLSVQNDSKPSSCLAILEVISPHSAQVSFLSLTATLDVEKMITLTDQPDAEDNSLFHSSLEEFKDRAVAAVRNQHAAAANQNASCAKTVGGKLMMGVLNPWSSSASVPRSQHLQDALDKLKERLGNMDYLSEAEKNVLSELQLCYRRENHPPLLLQPAHHSTPLIVSTTPATQFGSGERMNTSGEDSTASQDRPGLKRQNSCLARGRLMVSKAKQAPNAVADEVDGDYIPSTQLAEASKPDISHLVPADLTSEEDLLKFVHEQYGQTANSGLGLEMAVQSLVMVTQHYMATHSDQLHPQNAAVQFLMQKVLKTSKQLKALYQNLDSDVDEKKKITEHKMQVLLRLEMESVRANLEVSESELERTTDEVVDLLRGLLFVVETGAVPKFLNTTILTNYSATLPQLLVNIYEELMQPLPPALAEFASPCKMPSVLPEPFSTSSQLSCPNSDQDSQLCDSSQRPRTRSLRAHPSLTGLGSKRQIVVQAKAASKKSKTEPKPKAADRHKSSKHKVKAEVKRARRNLFDAGSKKQTDKPSTQPPRPGTAKKTATPKKSTPRKRQSRSLILSPPGGRAAAKVGVVAETPHHQRSRLSWLQQQVQNQQLAAFDKNDVQVVAESPVKGCPDLRTSPGRYKPAMRIMRKAFYSAGQEQRSRNLARALELSDRIAGRQRPRRSLSGARLSDALSSGGQEEEILSPTRQASAFLRAQLMKSPTAKLATPTKPSPQQPDLTSPSQNTRSRTPQRFPVPRLKLFQAGEDSASVQSPAFAALDFMSPVKRQSAPLVMETPPRLTRAQSATLVMNTPTKFDAGPTTPTKPGSNCAGYYTPKKSSVICEGRITPKRGCKRSASCAGIDNDRAESSGETPHKVLSGKSGRTTPKKAKIHTTHGKNERGQFGILSPNKRSRRDSPGEELRGQPQPDKSPVTQSSILDYVSPKHKLYKPHETQKTGQRTPTRSTKRLGLEQRFESQSLSTLRDLPRISSAEENKWGSSQPSQQGANPSRSPLKAALLSPKQASIKSALFGQFMSPTKTSTKPILKNSPLLHILSSPPKLMKKSYTPQKSPRVTFDMQVTATRQQSPSESSSRTVRTLDLLDKWPRKKRRWPHDSKSPTSRPSPRTLSADSVEPDPNQMDQFQSETEGFDVSTPRKRRRTDAASMLHCDKPFLFSDNAVDSPDNYFTMSSDDVFLEASVSVKDMSDSKKEYIKTDSHQRNFAGVGSPVFKGKSGPVNLVRCKSSFADENSRGFEGSQGFEIRSHESKPPSSPTFSSSPVVRRVRTKSKEKVCPGLLHGERLHIPGAADIASEDLQSKPPTTSRNCSPQGDSSRLTPLRIKGTPTGRKFSPTVSTTSLVHLMNSPILFDNPGLRKDMGISPEHTGSPQKSKKSKKMLHL